MIPIHFHVIFLPFHFLIHFLYSFSFPLLLCIFLFISFIPCHFLYSSSFSYSYPLYALMFLVDSCIHIDVLIHFLHVSYFLIISNINLNFLTHSLYYHSCSYKLPLYIPLFSFICLFLFFFFTHFLCSSLFSYSLALFLSIFLLISFYSFSFSYLLPWFLYTFPVIPLHVIISFFSSSSFSDSCHLWFLLIRLHLLIHFSVRLLLLRMSFFPHHVLIYLPHYFLFSYVFPLLVFIFLRT